MAGQRLGKRAHGSWKLLFLSAAAASWHSSLSQLHTEQQEAPRSVVAMVPELGNSGSSPVWIAGLVGTVVAGLGFVFAAKQRTASEQPGTPVATAKKTPMAPEEPAKVAPEEPAEVAPEEPAKMGPALKESAKEESAKEEPVKETPTPQEEPPPRASIADACKLQKTEPKKEASPPGNNSPTKGGMVTGLGVLTDTLPGDWQSLRGALQQAMPNLQAGGAAGSLAAKVAALQPDLIVPPSEFQQAMQALTPDLSSGLDWFGGNKTPEAAVAAGAGKALGIIREAFTTGAEAAAEVAAEASRVDVSSFKAPLARAAAEASRVDVASLTARLERATKVEVSPFKAPRARAAAEASKVDVSSFKAPLARASKVEVSPFKAPRARATIDPML